MSMESSAPSRVAIILGGGVREALMAQSVLRACEGATVFASADAIGTLIGLPPIGRSVVFDDVPTELIRVFRRLRTGAFTTVVLPYPAHLRHGALAYFAAIPRRLTIAGAAQWLASERISSVRGLHPVEANWRLALSAAHRPMRAMGETPRLQPPEAVRRNALARWSAFLGGRRPLVLVPGAGNWSSPAPPGPHWPAERYAVVANQSNAERILLLNGAGDQKAVRETRAGIVKPTLVVNLTDLTVEEVAAISELSLAVIGQDGDAMHVAAAAGAVVLAITRRSDLPPVGERAVACWVEDFARFPARQVLDALAAQALVDSYA